MNLTTNPNDAHRDSESLWMFFLNKLPDKTKKWIFLSSVLAVLRNVNDASLNNDAILIEKLEEIFDITAAPRACIYAMRIKHLIWKSIEDKIVLNNKEVDISELHNKKLSEIEINEIVNQIKNLVPSWLKYNNDEDMSNDVKLLVRQMVSV